MAKLWLDLETFSEENLKTSGAARYARHPSTEVIMVQWAWDEGPVHIVDWTEDDPAGADILHDLRAIADGTDSTTEVWAHNSFFDRNVLRHAMGIDIPVERWRDTMVQAMAHGLPGSLGKVCEALKLPQDESKDKRGRQLIQMFCKPAPKGSKVARKTRATHPPEWQEFLDYGGQDVIAMRAAHGKLPCWNYPDNKTELALWHLDQRINDRGFAVDEQLADQAILAVAKEQARLKKKTSDITMGEVEAPSQRDALLAHILNEYGVQLPDMRADTLRRRAEDPELPDAVRLLITIRLEAVQTSTSKYKALKNSVCSDGRLRGTLQFAGAPRTERWAGRLFQPQNMPRPTMKMAGVAQAVEAIRLGVVDLVTDRIMDATTNALRGCIVAPPGRQITAADLSNIEGRGLAYLAGEEWKLQAFRDYDAGTGPDLYVAAYARAFNVPHDVVDYYKRQIGKVMELGLGYEGGVAAFITFAAVYGLDLNVLARAVFDTAPAEALARAAGVYDWAVRKHRTYGLPREVYIACEVLKFAWREAHPNVVALWKQLGDAARAAIIAPGHTVRVGQHLALRRDGAWLRLRLPSGRFVCYLHPRVSDGGTVSYMGLSQYTRQWTRISTYGGKFSENATQAFARDVLAHNMPLAEERGYPIVLTVHDELLTEPKHGDAEALSRIMARVPPWAQGLPLAAKGFTAQRYRKDD